jgi:Tfp pilus assembly protein PilN
VVLWIPSEYFFVEQVEVPPAVSSGELADYAELSMEAIAPFPLEQLRWGFRSTPDGQHILLYAALYERLKHAGYEALETYTWVLPDFENLSGANFQLKVGLQDLDEATLWQADIRPSGFKSVERSTRRTTRLITRILGYAAIYTLALLLLETLLFAGGLWLDTRQARIDSQATAVRRIEDKQSLMNKLEQVAQNELRPIAILEAANRIRIGLGNTGIEYDEVFIEGGNRLTIEGKANTINELNAYTEALRNSGNFQLVDTPQYITRAGKTTFTATLDYQHSEPPAAATTPASEGGTAE